MKRALTTKRKQRWLNVTRLLARDGAVCSLCDLPLDRSIKNPRDPMYITFGVARFGQARPGGAGSGAAWQDEARDLVGHHQGASDGYRR